MLKDLQDAARYAQQRGVVIVAAAGNEADDLGHPTTDEISPGLAAGYCGGPESAQQLPRDPGGTARRRHGIGFGREHACQLLERRRSGGCHRTRRGRARKRRLRYSGSGRILAGWSSTDATGNWEFFADNNRAVESGGGRYVWISGTSMASPHAAGVAALIRERHPRMSQGSVAARIRQTATPLSCPDDWPEDDERQCTGGIGNTSFFGKGMVNAEAAAAR